MSTPRNVHRHRRRGQDNNWAEDTQCSPVVLKRPTGGNASGPIKITFHDENCGVVAEANFPTEL
jgi:hypothetical protein